MSTTHWTIEELAERVADVLASAVPDGDAEVPLQSNGRVREVPDARTIRWYQTTGLVDRPAASRGRTALYGRRHLAQIVAIKRLQAEGRSLAEIQGLLAGIGDGALERLAALPEADRGDALARSVADRAAIRPQFWMRASEPEPTYADRTPQEPPPEPVRYAI
ncbi:MAG: MerR family transcriptional regulator, partial [Longimicrobiales bacterium]